MYLDLIYCNRNAVNKIIIILDRYTTLCYYLRRLNDDKEVYV